MNDKFKIHKSLWEPSNIYPYPVKGWWVTMEKYFDDNGFPKAIQLITMTNRLADSLLLSCDSTDEKLDPYRCLKPIFNNSLQTGWIVLGKSNWNHNERSLDTKSPYLIYKPIYEYKTRFSLLK